MHVCIHECVSLYVGLCVDFRDKPFVEFLASKKMSPKIQYFILHSIAMATDCTPTEQVLHILCTCVCVYVCVLCMFVMVLVSISIKNVLVIL